MTKQVPTRRITRTDAIDFLGRAEEFLDASASALAEGRFAAATSCAAHAGINASDAITGLYLGKRSSGKTHEEALVVLKETPVGKQAADDLGRLLKLKPRAEYEPGPVRRDIATGAVRRARHLVELAREAAARPS